MPSPTVWEATRRMGFLPPGSASERRLVGRFADAYQSGNVDEMVTLLTDDALVTMPPQPLEYEGHEAIAPCRPNPRQHPTRRSGSTSRTHRLRSPAPTD